MLGLRVELYLKTPLFPFTYLDGGTRSTFPADVVVVEGTLKGDSSGGFWLEVHRVGRADGTLRPVTGLKECIIPSGKVDFVRVIS